MLGFAAVNPANPISTRHMMEIRCMSFSPLQFVACLWRKLILRLLPNHGAVGDMFRRICLQRLSPAQALMFAPGRTEFRRRADVNRQAGR